MKLSNHKNKFILFASVTGFLFLTLFVKNTILEKAGFNNVFEIKPNLFAQRTVLRDIVGINNPASTPTQSIPLRNSAPNNKVFFITPETQNGMLASSYVFIAKTNTPTGPVPVKSEWSIALDQPGQPAAPPGIFMQNCDNSTKCTVHSGVYVQKMILTAESEFGKETAKINISSDFPANPFQDDVPDWAKVSVYYLYKLGVTKGYADGRFGSTDPVTRGQVVLMLDNLMTMYGFETDNFMRNKSCDNRFTDVPSTHYSYKAICLGSYLGWFQKIPTSQNKFMPDIPMKRGEVAQIIGNMTDDKILDEYFGATYDKWTKDYIAGLLVSHDFEDVDRYNPHAAAIEKIFLLNIMIGSYAGHGDYHFRPNDSINRAEIAKVIVNFVQYLQQKK